MPDASERSAWLTAFAKTLVLIAAVALLTFGVPAALEAVGVRAWMRVHAPLYSFLLTWNTATIVLIAPVCMLLRRQGFSNALEAMGFSNFPVLGTTLAALTGVILAIVALFFGAQLQADIQPVGLAALSVASPISEELLYRGLLFFQMRRWADVPFWPAALIAALLPGALHYSQGTTISEGLMAVGVASVGFLVFAWLCERWKSVWPAVAVHIALNSVWNVLDLGATNIGDMFSNIGRVGAALFIIAATLLFTSSARAAKVEAAAPNQAE